MTRTARSAPAGRRSSSTCSAPTAMTAANACTGYARLNTTGIAMPATNGNVSSILTIPSLGMPAPGKMSSRPSAPSTSLGLRRSQAYRPGTRSAYAAGRPFVVPLGADPRVAPEADAGPGVRQTPDRTSGAQEPGLEPGLGDTGLDPV